MSYVFHPIRSYVLEAYKAVIKLKAFASYTTMISSCTPQTFETTILPSIKVVAGLHIPEAFFNKFSEISEQNFPKIIFKTYEMCSKIIFSEWDFRKISQNSIFFEMSFPKYPIYEMYYGKTF